MLRALGGLKRVLCKTEAEREIDDAGIGTSMRTGNQVSVCAGVNYMGRTVMKFRIAIKESLYQRSRDC